MKSLAKEPRLFTIEDVIAEYEERNIEELAVILDTGGDELPSSVPTRFKHYDEYERCDLALSRLVIEALTSPTLRHEV